MPSNERRGREANKNWSLNDASVKREEAKSKQDPERGLRSDATETLGTDAYRDPHQEHPQSAFHKHGA